MTVRVLYFGPAQTAAGMAEQELSIRGGATLGEVMGTLYSTHTKLDSLRAILKYAVNAEMAGAEQILREGDEIAVIPPVSGGCPNRFRTELTAEALDVTAILASIEGDPRAGGIVAFEGVTRREQHVRFGELVRLEYQAYDSMALKEMNRLVAEARTTWPVERIVMVHRVGSVEPGDPSVVIAVACPHRAEAFSCCRWLIDQLKERVPIWKREIWRNGESTWVDPTAQAASQGVAGIDTNT